jgi:hypothetical protein
VALWPALILLGLWRDEHFMRAFQEREQITIRPEPRFRPRRGPANGRTPHDIQERPNVPIEALDATDLIELVRAA